MCRILNYHGYKAYIVGGCVRDLLLNLEPKDWDITTNALPEIVQKMFEKTYATGLQHGTITVAMNEEHFEVTTFRVENNYLDGRRPSEVQFVLKVEEDLGRRDLTINAIAYDPLTNELIDPYHGIEDLQSKKIRCVGSAIDRLTEDGLRIMRVARFAARFGYEVDSRTKTAMSLAIDTLKKVSKERIKDEFWKILKTEKPSIGLNILFDTGVLPVIEPEWKCYLVQQAIANIDLCPEAEPETKCAILCSWFIPSNLDNFSKNFKLSNIESRKIRLMLSYLDNFFLHSMNEEVARIFIAYIKNNYIENYEASLKEFLYFSDAIGLEARKDLDQYYDGNAWSRKEMVISGDDLIELGVSKGPKIKEILDACYLEILEEPNHNSKPILLDLVERKFKKLLQS